MKPEIFFEDDSLFAVIKPAGMHSVGEGDSVSQWLAAKNPDFREVSEKPEDCGLIHRLDQWTSGILLGAKSRAVWKQLRDLLKEHKIQKEYLILVEGKFSKPVTVHNFLGSPYRRSQKVRVYQTKKPRTLEAKSLFVPLKYREDSDTTEVRVICEVARRHQIRAHAASLGHPLVGDTLYGAKRSLESIGIRQSRQFLLHAATVCFEHPITKESLMLSAPASIE